MLSLGVTKFIPLIMQYTQLGFSIQIEEYFVFIIKTKDRYNWNNISSVNDYKKSLILKVRPLS